MSLHRFEGLRSRSYRRGHDTRVAVYSTRSCERPFFERANTDRTHVLAYLETRLTVDAAVLAHGYAAVSVFAFDGLMGFDMHGKAVGVIGTGWMGEVVCGILSGFGFRVLAFDPSPSRACRSVGVEFLKKEDLYAPSDIVTLNCPLTPRTRHMMDSAPLALKRPGAVLTDTRRWAIIDSLALIDSLKEGGGEVVRTGRL